MGAVYSSFFSDSSSSAPPPKVMTERERIAAEAAGTLTATPSPAPAASTPSTEPRRIVAPTRSRNDEFHPSLRSKRKEDQIDPRTVDPTLRLDLLAKVQAVKLDGGQRNLFQFGKAEAVPEIKGPEPKIEPKRVAMGPPEAPPPPPPPGPVQPPPPPPITFKYYGVATKRIDNKKTAFFLDGEEIILTPEGQIVKKRYRVVRINSDSVVLEDVELKREQTLKIAEDAGGTV
jgi:hypothetical protein